MGFFEDNMLLSWWWRRKLAELGYKPKPYDSYKAEGGCIICGRYERVFPLSGVIILCEHCFRNSLVARDVYGENVKWKKHVALNIFQQQRCHACGNVIKTGRLYFEVLNGRLCTKCSWKRLGGHSSVLKVWGERAW